MAAATIDSPLFNKVHQRIHNSRQPRQLSEDEQAEIAYAWDKLSEGQQEVAARHVKIALRAMGFQVNKADVAELLQQHGLPPDAGIPWLAFQEVRDRDVDVDCKLLVVSWHSASSLSNVASNNKVHEKERALLQDSRPHPRQPCTLPVMPAVHGCCLLHLLSRQVLTSKLIERSPQDDIKRAFHLFDLQQSGHITVKELSLIARQLQVDIEPQELQDMIAEFDRDGDGAINEEEFKAIVAAVDD